MLHWRCHIIASNDQRMESVASSDNALWGKQGNESLRTQSRFDTTSAHGAESLWTITEQERAKDLDQRKKCHPFGCSVTFVTISFDQISKGSKWLIMIGRPNNKLWHPKIMPQESPEEHVLRTPIFLFTEKDKILDTAIQQQMVRLHWKWLVCSWVYYKLLTISWYRGLATTYGLVSAKWVYYIGLELRLQWYKPHSALFWFQKIKKIIYAIHEMQHLAKERHRIYAIQAGLRKLSPG